MKSAPTEGPCDASTGPRCIDRFAKRFRFGGGVDGGLILAMIGIARDFDLVHSHDGIECEKAMSHELLWL